MRVILACVSFFSVGLCRPGSLRGLEVSINELAIVQMSTTHLESERVPCASLSADEANALRAQGWICCDGRTAPKDDPIWQDVILRTWSQSPGECGQFLAKSQHVECSSLSADEANALRAQGWICCNGRTAPKDDPIWQDVILKTWSESPGECGQFLAKSQHVEYDLERERERACGGGGPEDYTPSECWKFPQGPYPNQDMQYAIAAIKAPYDFFPTDGDFSAPTDPTHKMVFDAQDGAGNQMAAVKKFSVDCEGRRTETLGEVYTILKTEGEKTTKKYGWMFLLSTLIKTMGMQKGLYNAYVNNVLKGVESPAGKMENFTPKIVMCMESKLAYAPYVDNKIVMNPSMGKIATGFLDMFSEALGVSDNTFPYKASGKPKMDFYVYFTRPMMDGMEHPQVFQATKLADGKWNFTEFDDCWKQESNWEKFVTGSIMFWAGGDVFSYMGLNKWVWDCKEGSCGSPIFQTVMDVWRAGKLLISGQSAGTMIMGANNNELYYGLSGDPSPADPEYSMFKIVKQEGALNLQAAEKEVVRKQDGNSCTGKFMVKNGAEQSLGEGVVAGSFAPGCALQCTTNEDCAKHKDGPSGALTCEQLAQKGIGGIHGSYGCKLAEQCKLSAPGTPFDWRTGPKCRVSKDPNVGWRILEKPQGPALEPSATVYGTAYDTTAMLPFALRPHLTADWACGTENPTPPINCVKSVYQQHIEVLHKPLLKTPMIGLSDNQALIVMPTGDKGFKARYVDSEEMCFHKDYADSDSGKGLCKPIKEYPADSVVPRDAAQGTCCCGKQATETDEKVPSASGGITWYKCK